MRLIDADALKDYILRSVPNWSEDREIVLDCIANSPIIEERKKGKWIDDNCSVCGAYVYHGDVRNYCPNCGARMVNDEAKIIRRDDNVLQSGNRQNGH